MLAVFTVAGGQFFTTMQPDDGDPWWVDLLINAVVTAGILGWGMYIGSRRELIWTLRQRAERAEAEQELRMAQARGNERSRIAREMHDVLAHRISPDLPAGRARSASAATSTPTSCGPTPP